MLYAENLTSKLPPLAKVESLNEAIVRQRRQIYPNHRKAGSRNSKSSSHRSRHADLLSQPSEGSDSIDAGPERRCRRLQNRRRNNRSMSITLPAGSVSSPEVMSNFNILRQMPFWSLKQDAFRRMIIFPLPRDVLERHIGLTLASKLPFSRYPDHELVEVFSMRRPDNSLHAQRHREKYAKRLKRRKFGKSKASARLIGRELVDQAIGVEKLVSTECVSSTLGAPETDGLEVGEQSRPELTQPSSQAQVLRVQRTRSLPVSPEPKKRLRTESYFNQTHGPDELGGANEAEDGEAEGETSVAYSEEQYSALEDFQAALNRFQSVARGAEVTQRMAKCRACNHIAYSAEREVAAGLVFHAGCLRCHSCSTLLQRGAWNYRENYFYCNPCHRRLALQTLRN
ncbi:unnamed protein product [Protopolystoma xenopodis]|uniref:LIM zinc-binding domain-containing protein n=1 Tax=Protopolystoma xenopodis TaxID=117903 RepID=A0A3S5B1D7_9PLAT|nr:unnamed protein product [Protopolystoma xenopodis]